ncbi:MAG: hypothetical protein ACYC6A_21490 [Armatimonadota bacterium]
MVTLALKGSLILFIFVSLLVLPLLLWLPAEEALRYCKLSIAAMTMLWVGLVPLITLCVWVAQQYVHIRRKHQYRSH